MEPKRVIDRIWTEVGNVLAQVQDTEVEQLVGELLKTKRVFVTGEGRSGLVGKCFAMRLMHIGLPVYVVGEVVTPAIGPGDLLVAVSGSGATPVTLTIVQRAMAAGARGFLVSSKRDSPIGVQVRNVLVIPGKTTADEDESLSIQPMGSLADQSAHLLLDAVIVLLMDRLGVKEAETKVRHTNL
jgi:6-phospho-3-hexuloisomerase